ncbi:MAG: right-handed parallel beta-helix repeat-containing protein [Byssovorax sp.]
MSTSASSSTDATSTSSTSASGTGGAGGGGLPPCMLTDSGPVKATADGQIIERLRITADGMAGITIQGFKGVVVRDVEIHHKGGVGIDFSHADDLTIENVSVEHTGAPAKGPNPSSEVNNILGYQSSNVHIRHARVTRGSSGIYLQECPTSVLQWIEGHDFRGPFPRGQLVQWNNSNDGLLEDFSVVCGASSWTEDNVNVYKSLNATVRRGLVDGNNSPSGVGVIFDGDTSTGLVEDVDAVHMGNGCFSNYAGADGNVFRRTRCRDNICTDQGRGLPGSNALMWAGKPGLTHLRLEDSTYFASCNGNLLWPAESFEVHELSEKEFTLRAPVKVDLCWE